LNLIKFFIKKIVFIFYFLIYRLDLILIPKNKNIIVFDIDNTLANTWPSLKSSMASNQYDFYRRLPLINDAKYLVEESQLKGYSIFFLSARDPRYWLSTKFWLSDKFNITSFSLRLVPNVKMKIGYWKKLSKQNKLVVIDDLSYNHENNNIKFYKPEIDYLSNNNNIKYFGYHDVLTGLNKISNKL